MLDKAKIEARLKGFPKDKCVAFAVRSAMRALPLLAASKKKRFISVLSGQPKDAFWYWNDEYKSRHLLSIFRAYSYGIVYVINNSDFSTAAAYDAAADAYAADTFATTTIITAYAAATAATVVTAATAATAATLAAEAYAYAADASYMRAIEIDLMQLGSSNARQFLDKPLWPNEIPETWQPLLSKLKQDALSLNTGFEIWLDWFCGRVQGRPIDTGLLLESINISKEIQGQGAASVNAYLKSRLQKNTTQPLNRVRAIFIGYGEAGKTSLIRALHGEDVIKGKEAMTAGIDIREWPVPETDIQAHFWDFGGQVVFHSTHKFFLRSSCVYIIVINARSDINSSEQAEYWLEHVKVFGGSAPVLLVGNKYDEAHIHLQMESLHRKYPNMIKGFFPLSCTQAKTALRHQFDSFKNALTKELQAVGLHQVMFTPAQAKVLEELRQNSLEDAFLSEDKFQQICNKHGVGHDGELGRDWLVDIFDKLGVMLHFDDLKMFHNAYMLNPRWLTHGVYTLMNAKQSRLTDKGMVKILANTKVQDEYRHLLSYPSDKCVFISKVMQRFKLCYLLPNATDTLMIPALLGDELPKYPAELQSQDTLCFEFAFNGFLPRNLIGEFMVSRHEEIKGNSQSQRGAVFISKSLQAEALVEADYHRRMILMQVYGRDAKEYLTILYDSMLAIFGDLALDKTEKIYLPLSACLEQGRLRLVGGGSEKAPYQQILALARNKEPCCYSESGLKYDLNKVLGSVLSVSEQNKQGITHNFYGDYIGQQTMKTINMSGGTVNGPMIVAEIIDNCFNHLQKSNADNQTKTLLEQLLVEIKLLNAKVPASQIAVAQSIAEEAETLVTESCREQPRKRWYQTSLEGIKEAAVTLQDIGKPVLDIAMQLSALL